MEELTITAGGVSISGWEEIGVTLRAEGFPNTFDIGMSAPTKDAKLPKAGDPCAVKLGGDLVVTGYVDRVIGAGDASHHAVQLVGRGKTQDLVDCSAEWPSGTIRGNALSVSKQLASKYGIEVVLGEGASAGPELIPWALNYGETGAEIIQRIARNAGLLAYEDNAGRLVLATLGTTKAASGVKYGVNVQAWSAETSMDGRFSEVVCCLIGTAALEELPGGDFFWVERDPNVPRHRQMDLVLEQQSDDPREFTKKKAIWEVARRAGRGLVVRATVDSWRDEKDKLWTPNTIVPVDVPGADAADLALGEVSFRKSNESGTTADLMLMPSYAFAPEPVSLVPVSLGGIDGP
jgi:prophage tail gpP-like protein